MPTTDGSSIPVDVLLTSHTLETRECFVPSLHTYLKQVCKLRVVLRDPFEKGALASTNVALHAKRDTL